MRKLVAGILLGGGAAASVLLLAFALPGPIETAELKLYDWRIRGAADSAAVSRDVAFVEINDTSVRDLEQLAGRWPWPRVVLSSVIDFVNRGKPKVIAIDLTALERDRREGFPYGGDRWSGAESDAALVDAVRRAGNVVLLADAVYEGTIGSEQANTPAEWTSPAYRLGPAIEQRRIVIPPFQELTAAAAGLGHNFLALDPDGPARRMAPFIRVGDKYMPSLGVAAALHAGGFKPEEVVLEHGAIRIRDRLMPLVPIHVRDVDDPTRTHEQLTTLINYRAPALRDDGKRPYDAYEVRHVLLSDAQIQEGQPPMIDPSVFRDRIVFVGLTLSGSVDVFNTPFGEGRMPGIQLHASMAESVLSNRFIRPARDGVRVWTTIGLALIVGLLAALLPFAAAAAGTLLAIAGWTWYGASAFERGTWINMAQPLLAMSIALFAGTAYQYFVEGRQKRIVKKLFGRYVSRDVYAQLVAHPELAELGGRRRDMTVLFSDIRGFTSVTEKGNAEDLVAQLNEYFSRMVEVVFRHQGTVDKFVGDMVMALFGAPLDDRDHAEHAVQAGIGMVRELAALNAKWTAEGRAQLDIGIGINSGEMIAGNIGSTSIMSYTVIGDNVNLASRLESLNKEYGTRIIISDATRARLTTQYEARPLGDVVVKGKTRAVAIFEIVVPSPVSAAVVSASVGS